MKAVLTAMTSVAILVGAQSLATAAEIAFAAWGGTMQEVQKKTWADKFTAETGIKVIQDGPVDYGKLKAMIDAKNVTWDVVDSEADYAIQAGNAGMLEKLDFSIIDKSKIDPRFVTDYSVPGYSFSFVIGCNPQAVKACPKTWADLFDTKKFPGKRTFYKWSSPSVLEAALLADGVPPEKLYPLDLDRAFKKLDTIKSDIVWWGTGAQSQQLIASGEAPYGSFWNGRLTMVEQTGVKIQISWEDNLFGYDSLVVPKGVKNKEAAMKLIAVAVSAKPQAEMATQSAYSPINKDAPALMSPDLVKTLPDRQQARQVILDNAYWAQHRDEIGKRWYAWQSK